MCIRDRIRAMKTIIAPIPIDPSSRFLSTVWYSSLICVSPVPPRGCFSLMILVEMYGYFRLWVVFLTANTHCSVYVDDLDWHVDYRTGSQVFDKW